MMFPLYHLFHARDTARGYFSIRFFLSFFPLGYSFRFFPFGFPSDFPFGPGPRAVPRPARDRGMAGKRFFSGLLRNRPAPRALSSKIIMKFYSLPPRKGFPPVSHRALSPPRAPSRAFADLRADGSRSGPIPEFSTFSTGFSTKNRLIPGVFFQNCG